MLAILCTIETLIPSYEVKPNQDGVRRSNTLHAFALPLTRNLECEQLAVPKLWHTVYNMNLQM